MKIIDNVKITSAKVEMEGASNVRMRLLIGQDDGSDKIFMRHFFISSGGNTPFHQHNYEHLVKVENNKGIVVDENGNEFEIAKGQSIFVRANEKHQFRNPFKEDFEFICIIPNPEK